MEYEKLDAGEILKMHGREKIDMIRLGLISVSVLRMDIIVGSGLVVVSVSRLHTIASSSLASVSILRLGGIVNLLIR